MKNEKESASLFEEALRLASLDLARELGYATETPHGADAAPHEIIPFETVYFVSKNTKKVDPIDRA